MKLLMDDIQIVSGNIAYDKIQALPSTLDRIEAINYHCKSIENYCFSQDFQKAKWHFRSALSEFKSVFDVIKYDLKGLQLHKIWNKDNIFYQNLDNSMILKIMKKTRDLAVHSAHINGKVRKFYYKALDNDGEHQMTPELIFIDPIDKNFSKDLKHLTDNEIIWFNRQIQFWPAHFIIKEALFITYVELRNFLAVNNEDTVG